MNRKYWTIAVAAVFLTVAGLVYGLTREQEAVLLEDPAAGTQEDGEFLGAGVKGQMGNDAAGDSGGTGTSGSGAAGDSGGVEIPLLVVHVCGEVVHPGVYELSEGSRIFEAVEAAGGFTEAAAVDVLNLAAKLEDGLQIVVYSEEEAETLPGTAGNPGLSGGAGDGPAGLVNLNTASREQLMTLKGIGESRAEDIIRYREESGGFRKIEDIMKVPGIKEAGFQKIKDRITV